MKWQRIYSFLIVLLVGGFLYTDSQELGNQQEPLIQKTSDNHSYFQAPNGLHNPLGWYEITVEIPVHINSFQKYFGAGLNPHDKRRIRLSFSAKRTFLFAANQNFDHRKLIFTQLYPFHFFF